MTTAKIVKHGKNQAVNLPEQFHFDADEVLIKKVGKSVILLPKDKDALWEIFMEGLNGFSDDFMEDGRLSENPVVNENL